MTMQTHISIDKMEELESKLDTKETKHEKEVTITCTSTAKKTGSSSDQQENVVITDQVVPVEKTCHNNDQEKNEMLDKQDEDTSPPLNVYERKRKAQPPSLHFVYKRRQVQATSFFSRLIPRHEITEVDLKGQQSDVQISPPAAARVETVSSKSSSGVAPKNTRRGRKSQALTAGSSSRSVPRKRNRQSGIEIEEIEDGELNSRRQTYLPGKNEESPSIFDQSPKEFNLVDTNIGYKESLLNFVKDLGPTAQSVASKKLKLLSLAQTTAHSFQAPVPHPSSACRLSNDPKGKSVIMDTGIGSNSVSAGDEKPMGPFNRVGTLSAGSAYNACLPDASRIQRSADVVPRALRENVHYPTLDYYRNQLAQQQHQSPSNAALTNAYSVQPGYPFPLAHEARPGTPGVVLKDQDLQPRQNAHPLTTVRPSRLSTMCSTYGSSSGVWGGHQSAPLNELQRHANPPALGLGLQQNLHNSHMQLQNQLGSEARQQQHMELEQPLPVLRNMFDAGTSHTGTSSSAQDHQTTSNAARNGQQQPSARRTYLNLELQLGTKPPSPNEAG